MSRQIDELLAKKMDRRDFLKHVGVGTLALFGFGAVVKMLSSVEPKAVNNNKTTGLGYGSGAYGGKPNA